MQHIHQWSLVGGDGQTVAFEEVGLAVRTVNGGGLPPLEPCALPPADSADPFSLYQRARVASPRTLSLRLFPRLRNATVTETRRALIAALTPDLLLDGRVLFLRCHRDPTIQIPVVYRRGLEGAGEEESILLEFYSITPTWEAVDYTEPIALPIGATFSGGYVFERPLEGDQAGQWAARGAIGGSVYALATGNNTLYAGGAFASFVSEWTGTVWQPVASETSAVDGMIMALHPAPAGQLYVGGLCTGRVQRWDGTAWQSLAFGDDYSEVEALALGEDGVLYAGGYAPPLAHLAAKDTDDGATWTAVGGGCNGRVRAMVIGPDGALYVGGDFTEVGFHTAGRIAVWNPASQTWSAMGNGPENGLDGAVYALCFLPDGTLIAGGEFTGFVAMWNGVQWRTLGALNGPVYTLAVGKDGMLIAGGTFTEATGVPLADRIAQWNGYAWFPFAVDLPASVTIRAVAVEADGTLTVGSSAAGGEAVAAGITTLTNHGSAATYPILTITGPGEVQEITNWTTGDRLFLHIRLMAGETLTLDLRPGIKTATSSLRGNVLGALVPGSHFATWRLLPGDNQIGLYVREIATESTPPTATITWYERYWSVD